MHKLCVSTKEICTSSIELLKNVFIINSIEGLSYTSRYRQNVLTDKCALGINSQQLSVLCPPYGISES